MTTIRERDVRHAIAAIITERGGARTGAMGAAVDAVLRAALEPPRSLPRSQSGEDGSNLH